MTHRMTRRHVLKAAFIGSAGLVAAACAPATAIPQAPQATQAPAATAAPEATTAPAATAAPEATTAATTSEKEAPMLAELVKQGKLPPLEQRLPPEPMVLTPIEEVGVYGGQMAWIHPGPSLGAYEFQFLYEAPYRWSADATKVEPNLFVAHKYSEDGMSLTLTLRK